jgi:hypothetical protein
MANKFTPWSLVETEARGHFLFELAYFSHLDPSFDSMGSRFLTKTQIKNCHRNGHRDCW